MATIDFNQILKDAADAGEYGPVPIGAYEAVVTEAAASISASGNHMIKFTAKIANGPHMNRTFNHWSTLLPTNAGMLARFLREMAAFGMDNAYFASLGSAPDLHPVVARMVGKRAKFKLKHEVKDTGTYAKVVSIEPASSFPSVNTPMAAPVRGMAIPPIPPVGHARVPVQSPVIPPRTTQPAVDTSNEVPDFSPPVPESTSNEFSEPPPELSF